MRKPILFALLLSVVALQVNAQMDSKVKTQNYFSQAPDRSGFYLNDDSYQTYFNIGIGYSIPGMRQTLVISGVPTQYGVSTYKPLTVPQRASFLAGMRGSLALGHMFSKYVGLELGASIGLTSDKYTYEMGGDLVSAYNPPNSFTTIKIVQHSSFPVILTPSLVFQNVTGAANIYAKFGVALPVMDKITSEGETTTTAANGTKTVYRSVSETTPAFFPGVSGALGTYFNASGHVKIFAEVNYTALSQYAKQTTVKEYSVNGTNEMGGFTGDQVTTVYNTKNGTSPVITKYVIPYTSLSLNLGVSFNL